ncbi:MAG: hypothetical protein AB1428_02405 [Bacteroidota bacterium]
MHSHTPTNGDGRPPGHPWLWIGITGLAALMIVGFSAFVIGLMGTIERQDRQLRMLLDSAGVAVSGPAGGEGAAGRTAIEFLSDPEVEMVRPALPDHDVPVRAVVLLVRERGKGALILSGFRRGATGSVAIRIQNDGMDRSLGIFAVPDSAVRLYSFNFPLRSKGTLVVRFLRAAADSAHGE